MDTASRRPCRLRPVPFKRAKKNKHRCHAGMIPAIRGRQSVAPAGVSRRMFRCFGHTSLEALVAPNWLKREIFGFEHPPGFFTSSRTVRLTGSDMVLASYASRWSFHTIFLKEINQLCGGWLASCSILSRVLFRIGAMTAVAPENRDLKCGYQMISRIRNLAPCPGDGIPPFGRVGRGWGQSQGTAGDSSQVREPDFIATPVSTEQERPSHHFAVRPVPRKEVVDDQVADKTVGLGEGGEQTCRLAAEPASEPANQYCHYPTGTGRTDPTGVVSQCLQPLNFSAIRASKWVFDGAVRYPGNVGFRASPEGENQLH